MNSQEKEELGGLIQWIANMSARHFEAEFPAIAKNVSIAVVLREYQLMTEFHCCELIMVHTIPALGGEYKQVIMETVGNTPELSLKALLTRLRYESRKHLPKETKLNGLKDLFAVHQRGIA